PSNDEEDDDQLSNLVFEGGADSDSKGSVSEPPLIAVARPPIKPQVLAYFTPPEFDLAWQRIRPHVVQLSVETADGENEIGGVIVNPQGWVVTSLGGLRGARRVVVKQAPVDRLIDAGSDQLEDEVRGVLGVFPEHDIVIVGINRKLVSALVAPPLNTRPLVSSLHLIQTAPPGPDRWPWATEARVNVSPLDRGVPADLMNRTREKGFNIDVHSLGHTRISRSSPGGGLFDVEGRLVGINSSIQLEEDLLIISAATIQTLMTSVTGQTTEIHELPGFDRQQLRAGSEVATSNELASTNPEHPGVLLLAEFNSLTSQLGQRGWRASTPDEYEQWRRLADLYRQLVPYQDDPDQPPEFRRQVIREMERLNAAWRSELFNMSGDQVREFNVLGWTALKAAPRGNGNDPPIVFLAQVHLPVLNSPQIAGKPTVTMRIRGLDSYFIAPFEPSNTLLMPHAEWLVFVERTDQRPRSILDDEGKTLAAESLSILLLPAKIR
ncbi:MAG TPA: hypothetical protein PKD54_04545, partial [Pirellulaceae bacterium]|nr:hypothetical protein [Pirellulaceae bacterium]